MHVNVYVYVCILNMYVYVCICMYMYVYVCICMYMYVYVCICMCESEVITWILSIPLDYVLVEVVDGDAEVSEAACVLF